MAEDPLDMTDDELADALADFDDDELDELFELAGEPDGEPEAVRAYIGFDRLVARLRARGHSEDSARRIAAAIGRRKYGRKFDQLRKMTRKARMRLEKTLRSQAGQQFYDRTWALDDIEIVRGGKGGDGRTVAAYAAIFGVPTEIRDQFGHYMEVIDRAAFRRTLSHGDVTKRVTVLYNHGLGLNGEHHPLGSVPIGSPIEIRDDAKGLYTVTRFNRSELADAVLEAIKAGDIRGYSFRGRVFRSTPDRVPRVPRGGELPVIVRNELGLSEYGPTPIPFYADASIVAVRSMTLADVMRRPERERIVIARALLSDDPLVELSRADTEPDDERDELDEELTDDVAPEPDEAPENDDDQSTTPDPEPGPDGLEDVEDPEDDSPTDPDEGSLGTEGPPDEAPLPVSQAARSLSAADVRRKARLALITRASTGRE